MTQLHYPELSTIDVVNEYIYLLTKMRPYDTVHIVLQPDLYLFIFQFY